MKFLYLKLTNYIGIYNGMGLNDIEIDLSKCMYRTLIIRGENGSGKSTIFKALSLFPDPNDSFIPGQPAFKMISIMDRNVIYTIRFIHNVKANGERETTKAFIAKTINGEDVELNENGNVSSYKDILFDELSLDPNFFALSQLSSDDKGLATKKPAERKKFVNSIIESLEVYNGIYKAMTKESTKYKSLIDSLVAKLGTLGDLNSIAEQIASLQYAYNELSTNNDSIQASIGEYNAKIKLLDPDGMIQAKYDSLSMALKDVDQSNRKNFSEYHSLNPTIPIIVPEHEQQIEAAVCSSLETTIIETSAKRRELLVQLKNDTDLLATLEEDLRIKKSKRDTMLDDESYKENLAMLHKYEMYYAQSMEKIKPSGIDPNLFTEDEFILALETLKDIKHIADLIRSDFTQAQLEQVIHMYQQANWGEVPFLSLEKDNIILEEYNAFMSKYNVRVPQLEADIKSVSQLDKRPVSCKDDTCPFVSSLIEITNRDPWSELEKLDQQKLGMDDEYDIALANKKEKEAINDCIAKVRSLVRSLSNNKGILKRLPNGGLYTTKDDFFHCLLTGYDFSYMEKMYEYIDFSNEVSMIHTYTKLIKDIAQKCSLYESKSEFLEDLTSEIEGLEQRTSRVALSISNNRKLSNEYDEAIALNEADMNNRKYRLELLAKLVSDKNRYFSIKEELAKINDAIQQIDECKYHIREKQLEGRTVKEKMDNLQRQINSLNFALQQAEQYNAELATLRAQYDRIETIKHYSSPTKGIQLVFMELYMGRILNLANELLSFLFNGEYVIQPFIINESEFRIPCLGQGCLNDDISSMSSSQLTMISMIISFALLHTSSSKYNILKLDEIDGPLDENNRIMFVDVMNRIMDIMSVEQCIMVSHSSELQVDTSDVILLKSSHLSTDYNQGNIIWRY